MLTYSDLKKGTIFILDGTPCEILEYEFLRMQQRKPVAKTKIRNLVNSKVVERTFHYGDTFEEAEIIKEPVKFLYNHRDEFWFCEPNNPSKRFSFTAEVLGPAAKFLKPNTEAQAVKFGDKFLSIAPPVKVDLKVKEAPPGIKGDTAQGGSKAVTLETGALVNVPLFVNTGDIVRVNTETGEYVERVEKGKE